MEIFSYENLSSRAKKYSNSTKTVVFIFFLLFLGALISSRWIDTPSFLSRMGNAGLKLPWSTTQPNPQPKLKPNPQPNLKPKSNSSPFTQTCHAQNPSNNCHSHPSPFLHTSLPPTPPPTRPPTRSNQTCPDYFRWIHEDLRPWATTGITREMLERAAPHAAFRIIIVNGHPYIYHYHNVFQTRDVFTIWGILQLLRRYPGQVPDLDLMFNCEDVPVVHAINGRSPPPLFRYCKDDTTLDIIFPDWSFWGWPEVNLRPWEMLANELKEANERLPWRARKPYAYWKGNPDVAGTRSDLMKCNVTKKKDWEARLFRVNWDKEGRRQFKDSNLANQCTYRYKVYIEGRAWSVSEKYIIGCDSPTLYVQSKYQDFVSRGLRPGLHYWPIPQNNKCRAIKQAVEWGNAHPTKMQAMGKEGSSFIHEKLHMNYVYDYMLHLLTEYSKLLTFKPTKPEKAMDLCLESVACPTQGKVREFLMESMAMEPINDSVPCNLPSGFEHSELKQLLMEKSSDGTKKVVESIIMKSNGGERSGVFGMRVFSLFGFFFFFSFKDFLVIILYLTAIFRCFIELMK